MMRGGALWWLAWLGCCCVVRCHPDSSRLSFAQSLTPSLGSIAAVSSSYEDEVCLDVDIRNSVSLFNKLENCSVVEGSVQILLIDNAESAEFENMTFPKLKEITGYLLLYRVQGLQSLSKLFPNLAVIRGDTLFHNYALVIYELRAILDVGLLSLTTIQRGSVRIEKNPHLCYVDTVDWDAIAKAGRGGHFIKDNKLHTQCPNTCPDTDCPKSSHSKSLTQQKLCWNSVVCQKICSSDCLYRNLTCSEPNACCHPECLGGCSGRLSKECIACRHVVYNGTCLNHCPHGTYKYLEHRCIEADKCRKVKNNLSISQSVEIHWKPILRECVPHCPSGYSENELNKHECLPCKGKCPKICKGAVVDSVSSAQKFKGCTQIVGSLEIQIQGGANIIKELESSLSSIQEIHGYLKVARSFPLVSLNFLRDLTVIRGEQLDKKEYALLVLDNQNLQELWDWKNRKTKLSIQGGKVFFHFNSKLCPKKIKELRNFTDVRDWDERDVSPSSNGDRVACEVVDLNITLWGATSFAAIILWPNFRKNHTDVDFRSLLGYVVYYRETTHKNVTIFDGRDACGTDVWKVDDIDASDEESDNVIALLPNLKPFTMYAAYMRTYTIASAVTGAQSPIIYFTTSPATPSAPVNVQAHANSPNEIVIAWHGPKHPNGIITHYIINGIKETDSSEFISQRNYCNEPLIISGLKKSRNEKINESEETSVTDEKKKYTDSESTKNCCSCTKPSQSPDHGEEAESQIQFEDFLHNQVYIKNPNAGKSFKNITINVSLIATFSKTGSTSNPFNQTFTTSPEIVSSTEPTVNATEPTTTPVPEVKDGNFFFTVKDRTYLSVKNLHHFTEYTIEVRACQDNPNVSEPCSSQSITTVRTLPLGGADDIDVNSIIINQENLTAGIFFVKWDPPKDNNGLIVNYHIEIKSAEASEYKALPVCITQMEYQRKAGYSLYDILPGNYSLRLRASSLAGNGNWTSPVYFFIPNTQSGLRPEVIALLIVSAIGISILAFGSAFYVFYKKRFINEMPTMLYASVNPEYMSAVYEPDEWEVPREKITMLQELGQGSFGMVYRGEFETDDQRLLRCAVKTVNESASLRERIEFLQEASVMKAFDCHHVVKLLGVVSKGHPTLVVMELMGKGDLKAYLRSRRPDLEDNIGNDIQPPTLREILQMAVEIADGMAYLAAKKFVHRDLAARNCMVSDDLTVKIGDFGMTRDIYETDYYRKGGKGLLPVRWMAPECLKDGLFSSQSDVWSYGVVIWEMATLASQPYQGLANEQVLHFVISGGRMCKPENCPEKLFAIMELCWAKNPKARPTFIELIDMLLPDINQNSFHEVSFYFTQRQETSAKETEDAVTASTPMRSQWADAQNSREESDTDEVEFFPPTRNSYHDYGSKRESFVEEDGDDEKEAVEAAAAGPSRASVTLNDVHSNNDGACCGKGMSAATSSSDDSKGSKVSTTSNGSIPNGRIPFVPCRTTTC